MVVLRREYKFQIWFDFYQKLSRHRFYTDSNSDSDEFVKNMNAKIIVDNTKTVIEHWTRSS